MLGEDDEPVKSVEEVMAFYVEDMKPNEQKEENEWLIEWMNEKLIYMENELYMKN